MKWNWETDPRGWWRDTQQSVVTMLGGYDVQTKNKVSESLCIATNPNYVYVDCRPDPRDSSFLPTPGDNREQESHRKVHQELPGHCWMETVTGTSPPSQAQVDGLQNFTRNCVCCIFILHIFIRLKKFPFFSNLLKVFFFNHEWVIKFPNLFLLT
jgi:hypothetical protein